MNLPKESIEKLDTGCKQVGSKLESVGQTKVMSGGGVPGQSRSDWKLKKESGMVQFVFKKFSFKKYVCGSNCRHHSCHLTLWQGENEL